MLTPDSVAQLTDFDHAVDPGYGLATIDFTQPYWFQWSIDGYGMTGEIVGYRSVLAIYPDQHLSVAILQPFSSKVDVLPYVQDLVKTDHSSSVPRALAAVGRDSDGSFQARPTIDGVDAVPAPDSPPPPARLARGGGVLSALKFE